MQSIELEIHNPSGLHARPASWFVRIAAGFRSRIRVSNLTRGGADVDAKSILAVLQLGVSAGSRIRLTADGEDEVDAIETLRAAIEAGLGDLVDV